MTSLNEGASSACSGGSLASAPSLSEAAVDPPGTPSGGGLAPPVRLEPWMSRVAAVPWDRAAASPSVDRTSGPGTHLPIGVPSSLTAMWACRRAWARTQQQLELEVWPA
jgi:hypothetical protein